MKSTIERLAELAKRVHSSHYNSVINVTTSDIVQAEAEYKAVVAENERLREALEIIMGNVGVALAALAHSQEVGNDRTISDNDRSV